MTLIYHKPPQYHAYILRCWEMRSQYPHRPATWRYSVENSQTREKHTFTNVKELLAFLQVELGNASIEIVAATTPER